jgi:hypothetical protein
VIDPSAKCAHTDRHDLFLTFSPEADPSGRLLLHPDNDDRDALGEAMNFNRGQERFAAQLRTGQCVVFGDGLERPTLLAVPAPATWSSLASPA